MKRNIVLGVLAVFLVSTLLVAPVAAQETSDEDEEEEDDGPVIDVSGIIEAISDLNEEIRSFKQNWDRVLAETLKSVLYDPFKALGEHVLSGFLDLFGYTPTVHPNPAVEDVHSDVLLVTYSLSGLVFVVAGLLHMIGPVLGVSYGEVRKILPRIVIALVFSAVSLPLLQLGVDFTEALTQAFRPDPFATNFQQMFGLSTGILLAYVLQSLLLVIVAVLLIIRNIYILFVAAISPLLAVVWSLPRAKRYADTFIAGWFAALMIVPLDMLVLKFSFALMKGAGTGALQSVSNWLLGVASLILLLLVPKQIWDASQAAVGLAYTTSGNVKDRIKSDDQQRQEQLLNKEQRQRLRENREKRLASNSTSVSYPWRKDS
ncbi:hypothetical protein [Haloarcula argentinensis]|uniref:Uncharacterized protein n=1 Tax=Haloarcula argentinensis TaxID=43776 RepID=A0A847ULL3_HALAR|nr:hypothetical protein [Haloarcula argentinensis]NLV13227.1 hypothetical protein [Haloarcula argentinensis]